MIQSKIIIDVLGWAGAAALLIAYGLVSSKKLSGDSRPYQFLNLAGSAFLILNSFYYGAYPSVSVNIIWVAIAIYTLINVRRKNV
jgi:hypothetical protein